jgi:hypothetical protein
MHCWETSTRILKLLADGPRSTLVCNRRHNETEPSSITDHVTILIIHINRTKFHKILHILCSIIKYCIYPNTMCTFFQKCLYENPDVCHIQRLDLGSTKWCVSEYTVSIFMLASYRKGKKGGYGTFCSVLPSKATFLYFTHSVSSMHM